MMMAEATGMQFHTVICTIPQIKSANLIPRQMDQLLGNRPQMASHYDLITEHLVEPLIF